MPSLAGDPWIIEHAIINDMSLFIFRMNMFISRLDGLKLLYFESLNFNFIGENLK
jgi:hypothetical protein